MLDKIDQTFAKRFKGTGQTTRATEILGGSTVALLLRLVARLACEGSVRSST